jgi:SAM-dependent methyltransferase
VWRAGQERRLEMIRRAAGERLRGRVLEDGCGVGTYLARLEPDAAFAAGLEVEFPRAVDARRVASRVLCSAGERLPLPDAWFDLVLSHEVLEHVADDRAYLDEAARVLKPGGRLVLFCPNRGYPFETHGVYWRGEYHFGNIPLVNYLPRPWRNKLVPHVRVYSSRDLEKLLAGLPFKVVSRTQIFGAYDNIIARRPTPGKFLRALLQGLENSPLRVLGLSHFWVLEKG